MVYGNKLESYLVEKPHPFKSDILCFIIYGLEPGWLGASFGLRNSYVQIIITRRQFFIYKVISIKVFNTSI